MLQGGISVNRYHRLHACKKRMKERYAKKWHWGNAHGSWGNMVLRFKDDSGDSWFHHPLSYWKDYYLSGPRQYAKFATNRKIRQMNREVCGRAINSQDLEDISECMNHSDYRKCYEYDWTIW